MAPPLVERSNSMVLENVLPARPCINQGFGDTAARYPDGGLLGTYAMKASGTAIQDVHLSV